MAEIAFRTLYLRKRFPLMISRGLYEGGDNLFVSVTEDGVTGWGEVAPGDTEGADTAEAAQDMLAAFCGDGLDAGPIHDIWDRAHGAGVAPCALAGLDMALWDLRAKQAGLPLYRMLGLARRGG